MAAGPVVIGVAGGSGSGKTTVVRRIVESLGNDQVTVLEHDRYYRYRSDLRLEERAALNYDHPDSLETDLMVRHIEQLRAGQAVEVPLYDFARYARLCQEAGIVPIVEPEVLMDADNTIERCYDVTARTLHTMFGELARQKVDLHGTILKPNMVIAGKGCPEQTSAERIAELTVRCFLNHVPAAIPGIVFLSGGQSELEATENLNAVNKVGGPWPLSFSYGRALQASALKAWAGGAANAEAAQAVFAHRSRMNALAAAGEWNVDLEQAVAA